jgi:DNA repair exonuclease SbcCD nuclease subunit
VKIALITDQHFGARGDNVMLFRYKSLFYQNVFFPMLKELGITEVCDLGDTFDRRKFINFHTLKAAKEMWFEPLRNAGITLHSIVGNHTAYFKNTNEVNTMDLLFKDYENIRLYSSPETIEIDGTKIAMLPWICSGNYEESMNFIKDTPAQILFGHLELNGFEMYRGVVGSTHGFERSVFDKFDMVCTGHFHHKSSNGNIHYLGAPYEMNWSDYDDERGFHILDTETRELTFIQNPYRLFHKIVYNDVGKTMDQLVDQDFSQYKDTFVKLIVKHKENPYWFDMVVDKIEAAGVSDLQVVEDNLNLNLEDDSDIVNEAEDTLTIMRKFVEQFADKNVSDSLNNLLFDLYREAITLESQS